MDLYKVPSPPAHTGLNNILPGSVSEGVIDTNNKQPIPDTNKLITDKILERCKQIEDRERELESRPPPQEMPIHLITSRQILDVAVTPFSHEETLPSFDHGSMAVYFFTTLRQILDKCTRAQLQDQFIRQCLSRRIIPKGFKLNKKLMAVDPTPQLKLAHYQITSQAESDLMRAITDHYDTAIPRLIREFEEYFSQIKVLAPEERRLIILKLIHYKNKLSETRGQNQNHKMQRYSDEQRGNGPPGQ
jgi:uncharacterized protein Smg (DUF494 family)